VRTTALSVAILGAALAGVGQVRALPSPPVLIDSGVRFVAPYGAQKYPAAAFDGTNWLVVWQDLRGDREAIWAARVSSAGVLLDSGNILVANDDDERYEPRVAFNGSGYLVVWQDARNSSYDIYAARVSTAGVVMDPDGIPVCSTAHSQKFPGVSSNGSDFLVVWQDTRIDSLDEDIYAARVNSGGGVLDPAGILVSSVMLPQEYPTVGFNGTNYLVAWKDRRNDSLTSDDIYAARVTQAGTVLDPAGIAVSRAPGSQDGPSATAGGSTWLVVWEDYRSPDGEVMGSRVSPAGVVLDTAGLNVTSDPYWQGGPAAAFDGANYFVTWEDDRLTGGGNCDIFAARVTPSGAVLDTGIVVCEADDNQYYPCIASGSSGLLVAWADWRSDPSDPDICCNRLSPAGIVLDTVDALLPSRLYAYEQKEPAVAFDGSNYLAVWKDGRAHEGADNVYGARMSPVGVVLDPGGFPIAEHSGGLGTPVVARGDSNCLVCWDAPSGNYRRIQAARVNRAGAVLDTVPVSTRLWGYDAWPPSVAFDGTNWLVVAAMKCPGQDWNVVCSRVGQDGVVLDSNPVFVCQVPGEQNRADVAFGAGSYLVVWYDARSGSSYDIYGARVSPDGTILDTAGIAISTAGNSQYAPSVAFDGTNWLVAWQDRRGGDEESLYYARVSQAGTVLDPGGIPLGWEPANYQDPLQMVFDGTNFFCVWQYRNNSPGDLWGARISPQGAVLDSFPVCAEPEYQATPSVALGSGGRIVVVYSGYVDTLRGSYVETMRIWAGIYPFYGIEERSTPYALRQTPNPTIVRGILNLQSAICNLQPEVALLDAAGRKVLDLVPGPNDVSRLAPGVYFLREAVAQAQARAVRKVIIPR